MQKVTDMIEVNYKSNIMGKFKQWMTKSTLKYATLNKYLDIEVKNTKHTIINHHIKIKKFI